MDGMQLFHGFPKVPVSMYDRAPLCLNGIMLMMQHKEITAALQFTGIAAPTVVRDGFANRFHEVHNMIDALNQQYAEKLSSLVAKHPQRVHDELLAQQY